MTLYPVSGVHSLSIKRTLLRRVFVAPAVLGAVLLLSGTACAPRTEPATSPAPMPMPPVSAQPPAPEAPAAPPAVTTDEAPANWQLLDLATDGIAGVGSERALRELLAGRTPGRTVVVAVIDGGVDTAHADLRPVLWQNDKERGGTKRDDDGNGYIDDVRGWNFIGGANGENVHHDTFEMTRLYVVCAKAERAAPLAGEQAAECARVREKYAEKRAEVSGTLGQIENIARALDGAAGVLREAMGTDTLTRANVQAFTPTAPAATQARQVFLQLAANGLTPEVIAEGREAYQGQLQYGLDTLFDPRNIVGDNYADGSERQYGNSDVSGPDAKHGSHVAGIIGAARGNNSGVDGVSPSVQIMALRAVPDGDERDKDVANAIRYAADNGAHIINMSFGKGFSPEKGLVDDAVRYAESKGVLLVHAAGNDSDDIDEVPSFPTPFYADGTRASTWIEVGASSWKGGDQLVASFSNFGQQRVDLFAPGADILSTVPGGGTERQSGTSMAAPVVSGVAALLMAYYPELTAADVKEILLATVTKLSDVQVVPPGAPPTIKVPFGMLSSTGGIVNAYEAVKMAEARRNIRP